MMPLVHIALAFTFQVPYQGMSRVLTFMPTLSLGLINLFYLCKCLPFMCYPLVLSLLLHGVNSGLNLGSFRNCLKLVFPTLDYFVESLKPSRMRSSKLSTYPLTELLEIR